MEKKILVVAPRSKINYSQVYPAVIRALDLIREEDCSIRFITDGVTSGTTGLVVEAVNKIESSLISRGYDVRFVVRQLDVMLHGKQAHRKWIEKYLPESDAVLVFDTGNPEARGVIKKCEEEEIPCVHVQAKPIKQRTKLR